MVSRRSLLVAGVGIVAAGGAGLAATDRLDDALRAVGARPHRQPDAGDLELVTRARSEQDALILLAESQQPVPDAIVAVLREQAAGLPATKRRATVDDSLIKACRTAADHRADDCLVALSPDLVAVLASLSAGLTQVVQTLKAAA